MDLRRCHHQSDIWWGKIWLRKHQNRDIYNMRRYSTSQENANRPAWIDNPFKMDFASFFTGQSSSIEFSLGTEKDFWKARMYVERPLEPQETPEIRNRIAWWPARKALEVPTQNILCDPWRLDYASSTDQNFSWCNGNKMSTWCLVVVVMRDCTAWWIINLLMCWWSQNVVWHNGVNGGSILENHGDFDLATLIIGAMQRRFGLNMNWMKSFTFEKDALGQIVRWWGDEAIVRGLCER
jgi:hypothetical protein